MHFTIITPLRTALEADVSSINLRGVEGEMEILPGHTDLICAVDNGELTYRITGGDEDSLFVGGGFMQVHADRILLVTDTALQADDINPDSIQEALQRAQDALRNSASVLSRAEQTKLEASIAKQLAILDYNRKRRNKH
ncbi:MAG TPA: ATP synthase F1 subunit epsilon [Candidatus Akkermansia intestinigallinarum]|uniref:ATP synthase epsilon chain n=1 Tax=Candidatus Akkermansia intestinigallinarum TaxID=2838431 RepID=A0A9D1VCM5_9BACT|nr:ATP synthase F1 subunit epsilon [Candidatus Akkermansia intestinigallinarum]